MIEHHGEQTPPEGSQSSAFAAPAWAKDIGRWSWIVLGVVLVLVILFLALATTRLIVMATLFAVLFGATFLPIVDWLERRHLPRWLGALLVLLLVITLVIGVALVAVYGVVDQIPQAEQHLKAAQADIKKALDSTSLPASTADSIKSGLEGLLENAASGAAGLVASLVGDVASLIFGLFVSVNIFVWVLIQGRQIGAWASRHLRPVPQPVAYSILASSARFLRGYLWGSTMVGLFNAAVLGIGAFVIGVPLAGTIAILAWFTNYIPYFGAIISGAFTVLVALGAGGPSKAIPMLIVVIIANGFLQTLVSQFALGSALDLHPLVVLFATTTGGIVAGAVGGVFAAPFVKIVLDGYARLRDIGLFGEVVAAPAVPGGTSLSPVTEDGGSGPPGATGEPSSKGETPDLQAQT